MAIAGMDRDIYPGNKAMTKLWNETNLYWTGYYFPSPGYAKYAGGNHSSTWMGNRDFLQRLGWGIAPLYVSPQNRYEWTETRGASDGMDAVTKARKEGFSCHSVIYLDIEGGGTDATAISGYYKAWCETVISNHYFPGVYCSPFKSPSLMSFDLRPIVWVARYVAQTGRSLFIDDDLPTKEPVDSKYPFAAMWQWQEKAFLLQTVTDRSGHKRIEMLKDDNGHALYVDLNGSYTKDPSRCFLFD
jgi:hypothetical protein